MYVCACGFVGCWAGHYLLQLCPANLIDLHGSFATPLAQLKGHEMQEPSHRWLRRGAPGPHAEIVRAAFD